MWPPISENAYGDDHYKKGNFFTLRDEDHYAYDLFRALDAQGWEWDREQLKGGRHWLHMKNGDRRVIFSLFGQGIVKCERFENDNYYEWGISLEDYDYVWINALPHVVTFMKTSADQRKDMYDRGRENYKKQYGVAPDW